MFEDTPQEGWYSGVEPVDVGNLDDVREMRTVIPATKNVRMRIVKAENAINKNNTYRSINLTLKLTQGIGDEGKYKNMTLFARVCYFADPIAYTKDFFKTKQHLVQLKYLSRATGIDLTKIDGHKIEELLNAPEIKADITLKKKLVFSDNGMVNEKEEDAQFENEVRNFKALDPMEMV